MSIDSQKFIENFDELVARKKAELSATSDKKIAEFISYDMPFIDNSYDGDSSEGIDNSYTNPLGYRLGSNDPGVSFDTYETAKFNNQGDLIPYLGSVAPTDDSKRSKKWDLHRINYAKRFGLPSKEYVSQEMLNKEAAIQAQKFKNVANEGRVVGTTQYNRPAFYMDGEIVSEKSITIEMNGKWVNVPTIWDGKQLSEEAVKQKLINNEISPTSVHDTKNEALLAAQTRTDNIKYQDTSSTPLDIRKNDLGYFGRDLVTIRNPITGVILNEVLNTPENNAAYFSKYNKKVREADLNAMFAAENAEIGKDGYGFLDSFVKGVSSGVDNLQATGYGFAALIADATGNEEFATAMLQEYLANIAEAQANGANLPKVEDVDWSNPTAALSKLGSLIGEAIPSIAMMMGTGGIGGAIAKYTVKRKVKGFAAKEANRAIQSAATKSTLAGAYLGANVMETGSIYGDVAVEGNRDATAIAGSLAGGSLAASLEILTPLKLMEKWGITKAAKKEIRKALVKNGIPQMLKKIGKEFLAGGTREGLTEGLQFAIEETTQDLIKHGHLPDYASEEFKSGLLNSVVAGFAPGAALQGGTSVISETVKQINGDKKVIQEAKSQIQQEATEAADVTVQDFDLDTQKNLSNTVDKAENSNIELISNDKTGNTLNKALDYINTLYKLEEQNKNEKTSNSTTEIKSLRNELISAVEQYKSGEASTQINKDTTLNLVQRQAQVTAIENKYTTLIEKNPKKEAQYLEAKQAELKQVNEKFNSQQQPITKKAKPSDSAFNTVINKHVTNSIRKIKAITIKLNSNVSKRQRKRLEQERNNLGLLIKDLDGKSSTVKNVLKDFDFQHVTVSDVKEGKAKILDLTIVKEVNKQLNKLKEQEKLDIEDVNKGIDFIERLNTNIEEIQELLETVTDKKERAVLAKILQETSEVLAKNSEFYTKLKEADKANSVGKVKVTTDATVKLKNIIKKRKKESVKDIKDEKIKEDKLKSLDILYSLNIQTEEEINKIDSTHFNAEELKLLKLQKKLAKLRQVYQSAINNDSELVRVSEEIEEGKDTFFEGFTTYLEQAQDNTIKISAFKNFVEHINKKANIFTTALAKAKDVNEIIVSKESIEIVEQTEDGKYPNNKFWWIRKGTSENLVEFVNTEAEMGNVAFELVNIILGETITKKEEVQDEVLSTEEKETQQETQEEDLDLDEGLKGTQLDAEILSRFKGAKDAAIKLANSKHQTKYVRMIAKLIIPLLSDDIKISTDFDLYNEHGVRSQFYNKNVHPAAVVMNPADSTTVLLHELIHAATEVIINTPSSERTARQNNAVKQLHKVRENIIKQYEKDIASGDITADEKHSIEYLLYGGFEGITELELKVRRNLGMKGEALHEHELLGEFLTQVLTAKDAQSYLKRKKVSNKKQKTLWNEVVTAVRNLLNIKDNEVDSLLDEALAATIETIESLVEPTITKTDSNKEELPYVTRMKEKIAKLDQVLKVLDPKGPDFREIRAKIKSHKAELKKFITDIKTTEDRRKNENHLLVRWKDKFLKLFDTTFITSDLLKPINIKRKSFFSQNDDDILNAKIIKKITKDLGITDTTFINYLIEYFDEFKKVLNTDLITKNTDIGFDEVKGAYIDSNPLNLLYIKDDKGKITLPDEVIFAMMVSTIKWTSINIGKMNYRQQQDIGSLLHSDLKYKPTFEEYQIFGNMGVVFANAANDIGAETLNALNIKASIESTEEIEIHELLNKISPSYAKNSPLVKDPIILNNLKVAVGSMSLKIAANIKTKGALTHSGKKEADAGLITIVHGRYPKKHFKETEAIEDTDLNYIDIKTIKIRDITEEKGDIEVRNLLESFKDNTASIKLLNDSEGTLADILSKPATAVTHVKNSLSNLPKKVVKVIQKLNNVEWTHKKDAILYFSMLDDENMHKLAGIVSIEDAHITEEESLTSSNTEKEQDIEHVHTYIKNGTKSFFYNWVAQKQHRLLIRSVTINGQRSKIHRALFKPANHDSVVSTKQQRLVHKIAVAQALGFKTDGNTLDATIEFFDFALEASKELVDFIKSGKQDKKKFNTLLTEFLTKTNEEKNYDISASMHILEGITSLAKYNEKVEFTTDIMLETDAITNGYAIGLMQRLGVNPIKVEQYKQILIDSSLNLTKKELQDYAEAYVLTDALERIGIFTNPQNKHKSGITKSTVTGKDIVSNYEEFILSSAYDTYQMFAVRVTEELKEGDGYLAGKTAEEKANKFLPRKAKKITINRLHIKKMGTLFGEFFADNILTKYARDFAKDPVLISGYGASVNRVIEAISEDAPQIIYTKFADFQVRYNKIVNAKGLDRVSKTEYRKNIQTLKKEVEAYENDLRTFLGHHTTDKSKLAAPLNLYKHLISKNNTKLPTLRNFELNKKHIETIKIKVKAIYSTPVELALDELLKPMVEARDAMVKAGEFEAIAFIKMYDKAIAKYKEDNKKTPNIAQKLKIAEELAPRFMPIYFGPWTDPDAGIELIKRAVERGSKNINTKFKASTKPINIYEKLTKKFKYIKGIKPKSIIAQGKETKYKSPANSTYTNMVQNMDFVNLASTIMQEAMILPIHDAQMSFVNDVVKNNNNYNSNFIKNTLIDNSFLTLSLKRLEDVKAELNKEKGLLDEVNELYRKTSFEALKLINENKRLNKKKKKEKSLSAEDNKKLRENTTKLKQLGYESIKKIILDEVKSIEAMHTKMETIFGVKGTRGSWIGQSSTMYIPESLFGATVKEPVKVETEVTKQDTTRTFQSVPNDPLLRKGSVKGDAKDVAMRKVANGVIVEVAEGKLNKSSSGTSYKTINKRLTGQSTRLIESGMLDSINEETTVIMLARNSEFKGDELLPETQQIISEALNYYEDLHFVVGDMPNVDSQFVNYLDEIGANYTIYHTGTTPRIDIQSVKNQVDSDTISPIKFNKKLANKLESILTKLFPEISLTFTNEPIQFSKNDSIFNQLQNINEREVFVTALFKRLKKQSKFLKPTIDKAIKNIKINIGTLERITFTDKELERLTIETGYKTEIPHLNAYAVLNNMGNNMISLKNEMKSQKIKAGELNILNEVIRKIAEVNPKIRTISPVDFIKEIKIHLEEKYLLGFANQPNSSFVDGSRKYKVNDTFIYPETVEHDKWSIRYNNKYFNRPSHFQDSPSAFGSLTHFPTTKDGPKDAGLIHELQNDFFEDLFKLNKIDRIIAQHEILIPNSLLETIIESKKFPYFWKRLQVKADDKDFIRQFNNQLLESLALNDEQTVFNLLDELTIRKDELFNALEETKQESTYNNLISLMKVADEKFGSQLELEETIEKAISLLDGKNIAVTRIENNIAKQQRIIDDTQKILREKHNFIVQRFIMFPTLQKTDFYPAPVRGFNKTWSPKQHATLFLQHLRKDMLKEINKVKKQHGYTQQQSWVVNSLVKYKNLTDSEILGIRDNLNYLVELLRKNISQNPDNNYLDNIRYDNNTLELTYFPALVHKLIQEHIATMGKNVPLYWAGKEITEISQVKHEHIELLYAGPDELTEMYDDFGNTVKPEVGAMYSRMSKIKGIELEYVKSIPGLIGNPGGYKINLDNYDQTGSTLFNQRDAIDRILGQADVEALTVLIDAKNQKQDTLPHEYAHHYIHMFRDSEIVQEGIKRFGSEEKLVQAIGEQVVLQEGEAFNWWNKFVNWILDKLSDKEVLQILTDSFLVRKDLHKEFGILEEVTEDDLQLSLRNKVKQTLTNVMDNESLKDNLDKIFDMLGQAPDSPNFDDKDTVSYRSHLKRIIDEIVKNTGDKLGNTLVTLNSTDIKANGFANITKDTLTVNSNEFTPITYAEQSGQEVYVHEILHILTRNILKTDTVFKNKVNAIRTRVRNILKSRKNPHEIFLHKNADGTIKYLTDPQAEEDAAKEMYNYVFGNAVPEKGVLDEFLAYSLTNQFLFKELSTIPATKLKLWSDESLDTVIEKIVKLIFTVFEKISDKLNNKTIPTSIAMELYTMTKDIVTVNERRRGRVIKTIQNIELNKYLNTGNASIKKFFTEMTSKGIDIGSKKYFNLIDKWTKDGKVNNFVANLLYSSKSLLLYASHSKFIEDHPRVKKLLDDKFKYFSDRIKDNFSSVTSDFIGNIDIRFNKLLFKSQKEVDINRNQDKSAIEQSLLESFKAPDKLTKFEQVAITKALLKTDTSVLIVNNIYSIPEIMKLMVDDHKLQDEIDSYYNKLNLSKFKDYVVQTDELAEFMVKGKVHNHEQYKNVEAIHNLSIKKIKSKNTINDLNIYVTLLAIQKTEKVNKETVNKIANREYAIDTEHNGITHLLHFHHAIKLETLNNGFYGNPMLINKGYIADITDEDTKIEFAPLDAETQRVMKRNEFKLVKRLGFITGVTNINMGLYISKNNPKNKRVKGIASLTSLQHAGYTIKEIWANNPDTAEGINERFKAFKKLEQSKKNKLDKNFTMLPILNEWGDTVNYSVHMNHALKEEFLGQNLEFADVMATTLSRHRDKVASASINKDVVRLMHDYKQENYKNNPNKFVDILSPAYIEKYFIPLTDSMKYEIMQRASKGKNPAFYVERKYLDYVFGYKLPSIANLTIFKWHPKLHRYAKVIEKFWIEVVALAKLNIIIKIPIVPTANFLSNFFTSVIAGVPVQYAIKHWKEGIIELRHYTQDAKKLKLLDLKIAGNPNLKGNKNVIKKRKILVARMNNNPVGPFVEKGLFNSITEDINQNDYTYRHKIGKKIGETSIGSTIQKYTKGTLFNIANQAYMGESTATFKAAMHFTQMSDFIARYTLYKYQTEQQGMNKDKAWKQMVDTFVSYDQPLNRYIQWGNDMGLLFFIKYAIRIQRATWALVKEKPLNVGMLLTTTQLVGLDIETIFESSFLVGNFDPSIESFGKTVAEVVIPPGVEILTGEGF